MSESQTNPSKPKGASYEVKRDRVLALLIAGRTQREAAEAVGVGEDTVSHWMQDPETRTRLEALRAAPVEAAVRTLQQGALQAAATLVEAAEGSPKDADRIKAAVAVLDRVGVVSGSKVELSGSVGSADPAHLEERLSVLLEKVRKMKGEG